MADLLHYQNVAVSDPKRKGRAKGVKPSARNCFPLMLLVGYRREHLLDKESEPSWFSTQGKMHSMRPRDLMGTRGLYRNEIVMFPAAFNPSVYQTLPDPFNCALTCSSGQGILFRVLDFCHAHF